MMMLLPLIHSDVFRGLLVYFVPLNLVCCAHSLFRSSGIHLVTHFNVPIKFAIGMEGGVNRTVIPNQRTTQPNLAQHNPTLKSKELLLSSGYFTYVNFMVMPWQARRRPLLFFLIIW